MVYHFAIDTCCKAPMPSRQSRHISGTRLFIETAFHLRWCGFRVFFLHYIILVQWYVARDVETFCNENGSKRFSGNWCTTTLTIYIYIYEVIRNCSNRSNHQTNEISTIFSLESCSQASRFLSPTPHPGLRLIAWHFHIIAEEFLSFREANATWRLWVTGLGNFPRAVESTWKIPEITTKNLKLYHTLPPFCLTSGDSWLVDTGKFWQEMFWRTCKDHRRCGCWCL